MLVSVNVRRAALLVSLMLLFGTSTVVCSPTGSARAAPTCRGVPATIVGTDRDDTLTGTSGDDVIVGGRGLDVINAGPGEDLICGGPTRYKEIEGDTVYQELDGGGGDDTVIGGSGDDYVYGSRGADLLIGRGGSDLMHGDGVGVPDGDDTLRGGQGADLMSGDEGADRMFGGSGPDWLNDFEGANLLDGGEGPDVLSSGPGSETIKGGGGTDAVSYVETLSGGGSGSHCNDVTADLSHGTAQGTDFGFDTLEDIESVWTGGGTDVLTGDEGPNTFYTGGLPCDESSTDSVTGNGGVDRITFNSERAEYWSGPGPVRVDLVENTARWSNQGSGFIVITLESIENVTGTDGRDIILGDAKPNSLSGGSDAPGRWGSDVLRGRGGADSLSGRSGNDWLYGGWGPDQLRGGYGADHLFGGSGQNQNDGGKGIDVCRRPRQGAFAVGCEQ